MSLKCEPASEPLHIYVKSLFSNAESTVQDMAVALFWLLLSA